MQKSVQKRKAFTSSLTLLAFLLNSVPVSVPEASAQIVQSAFSGNSIPNYVPANLNLSLSAAQGTLALTMMDCDMQFPPPPATDSLSGILSPDATGPNSAAAGSCFDAPSAAPTTSWNAPRTSVPGTYFTRLTGTSATNAAAANSKFKCNMKCDPPTDLLDGGSCEKYYKKSASSTSHSHQECGDMTYNPSTKLCSDGSDPDTVSSREGAVYTELKDPKGKPLVDDDRSRLQTYLDFLNFKSDVCSKQSVKTLQNQFINYKCKTDLLSSAVQKASQSLQTALTQNTQNFTKMVQFQKQVGDQMSQIDQILGPDPNDPNKGSSVQGGGLLGVQAALNKGLPTWNANQSDFTTRITKIQTDTTANNQTLQANRDAQVVGCMQGDTSMGVAGGGAMTCFVPMTTTTTTNGTTASNPVLDANGNQRYTKQACGPLQYLRSQVQQAPLTTNKLQDRQQMSQDDMAQFDSIVAGIELDMGANNQTDANGNRLVAMSPNWAQIQNQFANQIGALQNNIYQQTGGQVSLNIMGNLTQIVNTCDSVADNWKNQQLQSAGSPYSIKKNSIQSDTNKIIGDMTSGLSDMNGMYSTALSSLGATTASYTCNAASNDLNGRSTCYADLNQRLNNLLNGNGVGTTTKTINGGSMVGSFSVACQGINNCITTFQSARQQKKTQLSSAQKATDDFVTNGNAQIQSQLQSFAQALGGLQGQVNSQFANMQSSLMSLGIESTAHAKYMDPEQLQPQKGQNGELGPFESPKSMAAVLSGMVQPTGLMNFQDTGMQDMLKDAQDQSKSDQKALASDESDYSKAMSKIGTSCIKDGTVDDGTHSALAQPQVRRALPVDPQAVGTDTVDPNQCAAALSQCLTSAQAQPASGASGNLITVLGAYLKENGTNTDPIDKYLNDNHIADTSVTCNTGELVSCPQSLQGKANNGADTFQNIVDTAKDGS